MYKTITINSPITESNITSCRYIEIVSKPDVDNGTIFKTRFTPMSYDRNRILIETFEKRKDDDNFSYSTWNLISPVTAAYIINQVLKSKKNGYEKSYKYYRIQSIQGETEPYDTLVSVGKIIARIEDSENSMKGTKTAVWGKKSHRNDVVSYLENSVRRMF